MSQGSRAPTPGGDYLKRESPSGLRSSSVHGEEGEPVMTHDGFARRSTGGRHGPRAPNTGQGSRTVAPVGRHPRCDAGGKASDEIAMDHCEPRDVYRVLRAPDHSGTTSAAHEAAANRAFARALLIGTGRRGREIDFDVDPVRVIARRSGSCRDIRCRGRAASGSPLRPQRKAPGIHACRIADRP